MYFVTYEDDDLSVVRIETDPENSDASCVRVTNQQENIETYVRLDAVVAALRLAGFKVTPPKPEFHDKLMNLEE